MTDTGFFDPLMDDASGWDISVEDYPHEYIQQPYPRPMLKGSELFTSELINGSSSFATSVIGMQYRYTDDDILNQNYTDNFDAPRYDMTLSLELGSVPYMVAYPTGCKIVCSSTVGTMFFDTPSAYIFTVEDADNIGYALFEDETSAGLIFWYKGEYHFLDFEDGTNTLLFASDVFLSKAALYGQQLLGSEADGTVYRVTKTELTYIGVGNFFGIKDAAVITNSAMTDLIDAAGNSIGSTPEDAMPDYVPRSFTQNTAANKNNLSWSTSYGKVASAKDGVINVVDGEGRYVHMTKYSYIFKDWVKMTACPSDQPFTLYTPRYPCTDITVDPSSGELFTTTTWKNYIGSGIVFEEEMYKLHRLKSIKKIGTHSVDIEYSYDPALNKNTATVNIIVSLASY